MADFSDQDLIDFLGLSPEDKVVPPAAAPAPTPVAAAPVAAPTPAPAPAPAAAPATTPSASGDYSVDVSGNTQDMQNLRLLGNFYQVLSQYGWTGGNPLQDIDNSYYDDGNYISRHEYKTTPEFVKFVKQNNFTTAVSEDETSIYNTILKNGNPISQQKYDIRNPPSWYDKLVDKVLPVAVTALLGSGVQALAAGLAPSIQGSELFQNLFGNMTPTSQASLAKGFASALGQAGVQLGSTGKVDINQSLSTALAPILGKQSVLAAAQAIANLTGNENFMFTPAQTKILTNAMGSFLATAIKGGNIDQELKNALAGGMASGLSLLKDDSGKPLIDPGLVRSLATYISTGNVYQSLIAGATKDFQNLVKSGGEQPQPSPTPPPEQPPAPPPEGAPAPPPVDGPGPSVSGVEQAPPPPEKTGFGIEPAAPPVEPPGPPIEPPAPQTVTITGGGDNIEQKLIDQIIAGAAPVSPPAPAAPPVTAAPAPVEVPPPAPAAAPATAPPPEPAPAPLQPPAPPPEPAPPEVPQVVVTGGGDNIEQQLIDQIIQQQVAPTTAPPAPPVEVPVVAAPTPAPAVTPPAPPEQPPAPQQVTITGGGDNAIDQALIDQLVVQPTPTLVPPSIPTGPEPAPAPPSLPPPTTPGTQQVTITGGADNNVDQQLIESLGIDTGPPAPAPSPAPAPAPQQVTITGGALNNAEQQLIDNLGLIEPSGGQPIDKPPGQTVTIIGSKLPDEPVDFVPVDTPIDAGTVTIEGTRLPDEPIDTAPPAPPDEPPGGTTPAPVEPPEVPLPTDIYSYVPGKRRPTQSLAQLVSARQYPTTGITQGTAPRAPGEIESEVTGKKRRNVWNEASLRLKDALGL